MTRRTGSGADDARLPAWRLAAFASLGLPLAGAGLPLAVYLPAFYAQSLGLTVVGAVFMLTRVWDTVSDPLIGVLSDRTRTRFGRRKPWIAAGSVLFAAATVAIFLPAGHPTALYLGAWLFAFYLGWTMMQIPFLAWSGALSAQYHERSRVQAFVQTATAAGYVAVLALPALLDQGRHPSPRVDVHAMGLFTLITLAPALALVLFAAREPPPAAAAPQTRVTLRQAIATIAGDRFLARVLASDFAVTLAQTTRTSLFVFFVVFYLGQPRWGAALFLLQFVFGVFAAPIWLRIGYRIGKSRAAVVGELTQVAINLGLLLASPGGLAWVLALTVAQGLAQGSGNLMLRSIVADLADRQALVSGRERSGLLFSMFSMSAKLATAAAVGVALPLVAILGFRPGGHNSPEALLGLKLVFALGPAIAHAVSAALMHRFAFDEGRHAEVRHALRTRAAAVPAFPVPAE
jgi:GPH family glycoside/pentoside/hexuronide:cation symporter